MIKTKIFEEEFNSDLEWDINHFLDRLHKRQSEGLTTPKQIHCLEGRGFKDVGMWQFDQIAANGWRLPAGVRPAEYVSG